MEIGQNEFHVSSNMLQSQPPLLAVDISHQTFVPSFEPSGATPVNVNERVTVSHWTSDFALWESQVDEVVSGSEP